MNQLKKIKEPKKRPKRAGGFFSRLLGNLLGGSFLSHPTTQKQLSFLLFMVLFAVFYIANTYYAEKKIRNMERLQRELKELRFEYIITKSELMQNTGQSAIARSLLHTGIRETTDPPEKIQMDQHPVK